MKTFTLQKIIQSFLGLILLIALALPFSVSALTAPTSGPGSTAVAPPINLRPSENQAKDGSFMAQFLNATSGVGANHIGAVDFVVAERFCLDDYTSLSPFAGWLVIASVISNGQLGSNADCVTAAQGWPSATIPGLQNQTLSYDNLNSSGGLAWRSYGNINITNNGKVRINIPSNAPAPASELQIGGVVRIRGGNPGPGKVLTSNPAGFATWEDLPAGSAAANEPLGNRSFIFTDGDDIRYFGQSGSVGSPGNSDYAVAAANCPSGQILLYGGGHCLQDWPDPSDPFAGIPNYGGGRLTSLRPFDASFVVSCEETGVARGSTRYPQAFAVCIPDPR